VEVRKAVIITKQRNGCVKNIELALTVP